MLSLCALQGYCPGLTHGQRYGISYVASDDSPEEDSSSTKEAAVVQNSSTAPDRTSDSPSLDVEENHDNHHEPNVTSQFVNGINKEV